MSATAVGAEAGAGAEAEKKRKKKRKPPAASLADIHVKLETLQSLPMEEVFKIAEKASKQAEAKSRASSKNGTASTASAKAPLQPIDRVVYFLQ